MSTKLLDLSYWQGNVDFAKIKQQGYNHVILRGGYGTTVDSKFHQYAKDCIKNKIKIGIYWFCYAINKDEVKKEAQKCLSTIKSYTIDLPVFFDFEYDTIKKAANRGVSLTKQHCDDFTITFCEAIKKAGYVPGYYANGDYYKNMYSDKVKNKGYVFWLAHYKKDYTYHEPPYKCDFFQYSDRGKVDGISSKSVDLDVCFNEKYLSCKKLTSNKEENMMASLWTKTETLLKEQVGYLEKKSNSNLDNKTSNAGYKNYTKYSRDVNNMGLMGCQGQPWCATYQFWICAQIFGKSKALDIMGNGFYNCNSVKSHSRAKGTWHSSPKVGSLVIFRNGAHIGRVISISGNTIRTNEGNTSSGGLNHVEANGGCVAEKSYTIGNNQIDGYVWIDYGNEAISSKPESSWKAIGTATSAVDNLYVRAEPNGEVLGELMKGNRFEIDGKISGMWTHVKVAGIGVAWVATKYVKKDGQDKPAQKPTEPSKPSNKPSDTIVNKQDKTKRLFVGKVTASELCVRTWAGEEHPQIKSYPTLGRGNLVDVMNFTQKDSKGADWYYIRIAGKYFGFVSAQYIQRQ